MEKELTRQEEIYRAAARLFFTKGYHGTSMRDLAASVGVEQAALYYYYRSKGEILYAIMKKAVLDLIETSDSALKNEVTLMDKMRRFLNNHMIFFLERRDEAGLGFELRNLEREQQDELRQLQRAYIERFRLILDQGVQEGVFRPCDTHIVTMILVATTNSVAAWYHPEGQRGPDEIADIFTDIAIRGVSQAADVNVAM
ncbi:MAG: TetR/AcrR family transcriptional regulator [Dehalococcoidia bacterium]|nr:TetR/AcrR family transcriptional regulator [Dehalococcoidia bacterium]